MPKISSYPDGTTPQNADEFIVAINGTNYKLTWAEILAAIGGGGGGGADVLQVQIFS